MGHPRSEDRRVGVLRWHLIHWALNRNWYHINVELLSGSLISEVGIIDRIVRRRCKKVIRRWRSLGNSLSTANDLSSLNVGYSDGPCPSSTAPFGTAHYQEKCHQTTKWPDVPDDRPRVQGALRFSNNWKQKISIYNFNEFLGILSKSLSKNIDLKFILGVPFRP